MKTNRALLSASVLLLAVAGRAGAQIPTTADSLKTMQEIARTTLLLSDAIAIREMRTAAMRDAELADLGMQRASSDEIKTFATNLAKAHREHLAELEVRLAKLEPGPGVDPVKLGLGAGVGKDSVIEVVALYIEETEPIFLKSATGGYVRDTVAGYRRSADSASGIRDTGGIFSRETAATFRRNPDGTYVPDTIAVYRREAVVIVPVTEQMRALMVDSLDVIGAHIAGTNRLKGLTGKAFDEAFLDREIAVATWEEKRLKERIIPMLGNEELKGIANDRLETLGVQLRGAQELKTTRAQ